MYPRYFGPDIQKLLVQKLMETVRARLSSTAATTHWPEGARRRGAMRRAGRSRCARWRQAAATA